MGAILRDPLMGLHADVLNDLESVRIANENRLRTLTDTGEDGHGLTLDNAEVARLAALVDALKDAEKQATSNLQRSMRIHPLGNWAKQMTGVGEKQLARLLAAIGDPYWNDLHDRPRLVSELWSYAGYGVIDGAAPRRQRGVKSNWSDDARMRARLIAEKCVMQKPTAHYRQVYDRAREKYADATHAVTCNRCGPKGNPAVAGSPLSAGHQHARALRVVSKELLRDLWIESRRIHQERAEVLIAA
ncbi:Uncharacterised protein [Mycobacteroides abscessus subsp. abscessus]|uniref:hypothetical protein n=1 Tax=Mycobacteroides abscessus TaxID=36809 RepID=UPI00092B6F8E|nr:hypothetical protein [Mycobacteroides abscessus]SHR61648.1 Uncharacterised protein [Mycobacteroides abscessus subsp. abscessus]DAZ89916.1 TPA_asm: hypothetical protein PROPHIFSAT01-1_27 [Mycobacterium phage prophiFSAT01-1]